MRVVTEAGLIVGWGMAALLMLRFARLQKAAQRASHEIRGPLLAMRLALFTASRSNHEQEYGHDKTMLAPHIRRVELALKDLERTLFSGKTEKSGSSEQMDLYALVSGVVDSWKPVFSANQRQLELQWSAGEITVNGSRARIEQALANLLANAMEHGHGPVRVCGSLAGGRVCLEVRNRGHIHTLHPASYEPKGRRGHGLEIVNSTAKEHDGFFSSQISSKDSCVRMDLPAIDLDRCAVT